MPSRAATDAWYTSYVISIPAIVGSLVSFLYYAAAIWAVFSLIFGRYPLAIPRRAVPFVVSGLTYVAALVVAGLVNPHPAAVFDHLAYGLAFVSAPLLIARYRCGDPIGCLKLAIRYAPLGCALGVGIGLFQHLFLPMGVEGGAGNPTVFGLTMSLLAAIALAGAYESDYRWRLVAALGFGLGAVGVMLSDTRSAYPVLLAAPILAAASAPAGRSRRNVVSVLAIALLLASPGLFLARDKLAGGFRAALNDIAALEADRFQTSLGSRLALWDASMRAFRESPLVGHGSQNKMGVVQSHLDASRQPSNFTHVHNAWLDTAVAGGLLALLPFAALHLSPLFMVFGRSGESPGRRYVVLAVLLVYGTMGLSGMPFIHDLTVVLFVLPLILAAASDPEGLHAGARAPALAISP